MVAINSAESNRATLKLVEEVTWGVTPASGTVKQVRYVTSSLVTEKQTTVSEEIRADRMVSNIIETGASNGGEMDMEFAAGALDDMLEGFLLGTWSKGMNFFLLKGATIDISGASEITIQGGDFTPWLNDGQWLKLEGFQNSENNVYVSVDGAPIFSSGSTVFDVDQVLVIEAGSTFSKIMDAGDVLALSTTIQLGTNSVTNLPAATTVGMQVGQTVYIEGLGKGGGSVVATTTDPVDGSTITVSDGTNVLVYEVRTNAALVAEGNIHVAWSATPATMAASLGAAINGQFSRQNSKVSASVTADTVTLVNNAGAGGSLATSDAVAFTVTSFTGGSATKSGFFTVASITSGTAFTTQETITSDVNAGSLPVVLKGSHLRNPGVVSEITKRSYSIESGFTDVSKYFLRKGMRVGSIGLAIEAGELVSANVTLMGGEASHSSTETLTGGSYVELGATNTSVLNATSNVGTIIKDGVALSTALMNLEISGESNLREQRAISAKYPAGIGYGRFVLSGNMTAYFENFDLYDQFIDHDTTSIKFSFQDVDYLRYYMSVPAFKLTSDPIAAGGIDEDVMEEMEWQAQRDPVLNTQFLVDRFSSVFPFAG